MAVEDYINSGLGAVWNRGKDLVGGGIGQLNSGSLYDPMNITGAMGFTNPNSTKEGQALNAQRGDLVSWGGTAADANRIFGADINAPQVGKMGRVVVGTDPNGQPIYGPSNATVAAPEWQQAQTAQAGAATAGLPPAMQAAAMQAAQANAATMNGAQLDLGQANQARANQNALVSSLQGTASGQGPSVAQQQLRQATSANINQQQAAAQSLHGASRLAALRNAQFAGAQQQQMANSQASALRAQEIAAAQSNLGNALGMQRGMDINAAAANAGLAQQTGQTNAALGQQAGMLNAQLSQQAGAANAGFIQAANLANMNTMQERNLFNAGQQQNANQFNAGALNTSALNFAQQQNQGNLALANANLLAQQQTNMLNTQRGQNLINAEQRAAQGQTDINTTKFQGTVDYNADKRQQSTDMAGSIMDNAGSLLSLGGLF